MKAQEIIDMLQARVDKQLGMELATPIACTPGELQALLDLARAGQARESV